jgi:hypothetical protein
MAGGHFGATIAVGLLDWLLRKRVPEAAPDPESGRHLLSFGRVYRVTVVVFFALACGLVALGLVAFHDEPRGLLLYMAIMGALWAGTAWALYDALWVRITFSTDALIRKSPLGGDLWMPWSSVASVTWSDAASWFVFRSTDGKAIRISVYRNGLGTLSRLADEALSRSPAGRAPFVLHQKAANPA